MSHDEYHLEPIDLSDPRLAVATSTARTAAMIVSAYEERITKYTVDYLSARMSGDPNPPMLFSHPSELEEFSHLAVAATAAAMIGDAPAVRAFLLRMGCPKTADVIAGDAGMQNHGATQRILDTMPADVPAGVSEIARLSMETLAGDYHLDVDVPDFPDDAA
jgi:hypothetical protein